MRPAEGGTRGARESFRQAVCERERRELLSWAGESGNFILEADFAARWKAGGFRGESEHQVYFDRDTGEWWKRNLLNFHDGSISAYLERLAIQKLLFPELAPRFEGFTTFQGDTVPVISQPDAIGTEPSEEQVTNELKLLGFVEAFEPGLRFGKAHQLAVEAGLQPPPLGGPRRIGFLHPGEGIWLEDVHGENAVISAATGRLEVFDPVASLVNLSRLPKLRGAT
ncbi:MAG TPA: hypothetical protein VGO11_15835 [Chthoniobacteraceae bacterium]|nr:hypothetical protein [Chthoniobacteraceae bacterium]